VKKNDETGALELIKASHARPQQAAPDFLLRKGDVAGHEFHGNQYVGGGGSSGQSNVSMLRGTGSGADFRGTAAHDVKPADVAHWLARGYRQASTEEQKYFNEERNKQVT
jgi:hypothetical protein